MTAPGTYRYWLVEVAEDGKRTEYGPVEATIHPASLTMRGPFPNPVLGETELLLLIPEHLAGTVELRLFDLSGRQIGETISLNAQHDCTIRWDAATTATAPGLYWWRLRAGDESVTKAMIVVR